MFSVRIVMGRKWDDVTTCFENFFAAIAGRILFGACRWQSPGGGDGSVIVFGNRQHPASRPSAVEEDRDLLPGSRARLSRTICPCSLVTMQ
jgi:hypothetical protein